MLSVDQHVVRLGGELVAHLTNGLYSSQEWHDAWISDGAMMGCIIGASARRAARWDLFSPIRPLVAGEAEHLCLSAVG